MKVPRDGIAVIVFAGLLVFACGGSSQQGYAQSRTAAQIAGDASKALASVESAHVTVTSTYEGAPGRFDADIDSTSMRGSMTIASNTLKLVTVQGQLYLYGPDLLTFAHVADPGVRARVGDKWIVMPSGLVVDPQTLQQVGDFRTMASCVDSGSGYTKKGTTTIRGASVVEVADAAGTHLFVATAAPHYPLRIAYAGADPQCSGSSQGQPGTIDLSEIGQHFKIDAPQNSADLSSIGLSPGG